ncbi:MAG: cupin domain-containing protein [Thermacetogeniaceae bacterium]
MIIKDIEKGAYFMAPDGSTMCELLHPARDSRLQMGCSIAQGVVPPGQATRPHRISGSCEVYYILEGEGLLRVDGETAEVTLGQAVYVPPGALQQIENTGSGDLSFISVVDPMWRAENESF